ncbi:MAG: hypothetical protein M1828_006031 [Chrysothrix sp. TS-e1954]|nr:MAG: hypothetical protein M1828_006031 [Chrysothrix sp. TS-e1954]
MRSKRQTQSGRSTPDGHSKLLTGLLGAGRSTRAAKHAAKRHRVVFPKNLAESQKPAVQHDKSSADDVKTKIALLQARNASKISKVTSKPKMSKRQRQRREQLAARAEAVLDKREKDVDNSQKKAKKLKGRSADWDDLNGNIAKTTPSVNASKPFKVQSSLHELETETAEQCDTEQQRGPVAPQNETSMETVLEIRPKLDGLDEIE